MNMLQQNAEIAIYTYRNKDQSERIYKEIDDDDDDDDVVIIILYYLGKFFELVRMRLNN